MLATSRYAAVLFACNDRKPESNPCPPDVSTTRRLIKHASEGTIFDASTVLFKVHPPEPLEKKPKTLRLRDIGLESHAYMLEVVVMCLPPSLRPVTPNGATRRQVTLGRRLVHIEVGEVPFGYDGLFLFGPERPPEPDASDARAFRSATLRV